MSKQEIIQAINALTEFIKANSDAAGPIYYDEVKAAREKVGELIKQL